MTEPCPVCKRPVWDGGHALNERECDKRGGQGCLGLQAAYQRGYGDCAVGFIAAIVDCAKASAAQARLAEAAGDARRLAELLGGAEALMAFAKGFVGGARG